MTYKIRLYILIYTDLVDWWGFFTASVTMEVLLVMLSLVLSPVLLSWSPFTTGRSPTSTMNINTPWDYRHQYKLCRAIRHVTVVRLIRSRQSLISKDLSNPPMSNSSQVEMKSHIQGIPMMMNNFSTIRNWFLNPSVVELEWLLFVRHS